MMSFFSYKMGSQKDIWKGRVFFTVRFIWSVPGRSILHYCCLLYISDKIPYKLRNDLNVYCPKPLESVFTEVLLFNKSIQIIGTIYKHPSINVSSFTSDHFKNMFNAIHHENKSTVLTGDFNIHLLELLLNHNFTPQITLSTRVT